jgi:PAS domain S-box-containing protein
VDAAERLIPPRSSPDRTRPAEGAAGAEDAAALERQLMELAVADDDAAEVLARLAEAVFPGRVDMGDPARILWPEPSRGRASRRGTAGGHRADRRGDRPLEAQIRQSEARFRSLVEQLPAVVFYAALGDDENEAYVSPQIEDLLGFTQHEWLTNPLLWYSQMHPDDHNTVIDAFTRGMQTGEPFRAQVRFFSRSGEVVWILGEARLIRDEDGRPAYFQGVAFDITLTKRAQEAMAVAERARTEAAQVRAEVFEAHNQALRRLNQDLVVAKEAAEAAARARTTFLTTMSHELRTPLNSVIVLSGLLADDELTGRQQDIVRRMQLASDHLLELINDVLEFSRLRAGQVEVEVRTFDLVGWLDDALDIVAPRAAEKGLELRRRIAGSIPMWLTADHARLRQILLNLLANAVKFTTSGSVEVEVEAALATPGRWEFRCAVRDTGIGIRPEDATALFDEFRQADSGIAREFGGTGLGLAICRRLCELLGGRIWVEPPAGGDRSGGGATVVFTWVAEADETKLTPASGLAATITAPGAVAGDSGGVGRGGGGGGGPTARDGATTDGRSRATAVGPGRSDLRILVAEDNAMNQQVALLLLGAMGYQADIVGTGEEAIAAVQAERYDVVLMDVAMPGTDGLSATRAIRGLGASIAQPYIVAVTAHAFPGDDETCFEAGMDAYVAKPIDRTLLARAMDAGVRRAADARRPPNAETGVVSESGSPPRPDTPAPPPAPPPAPAPPPPAVEASAGVAPPPAVEASGPFAPARPGSEADDGGFDPTLPTEILTQFGPEPFRRLIDIFEMEATRSVAAAADAVRLGSPSDAEMAAHRLKSSAANLGARALHDSCAQLEAMARSGTVAGAESLTNAMGGQLAAALQRLEAMATLAEPGS